VVPAIGVDVGGTKCLAVLLGADGGLLAEERCATIPDGDGLVGAVAGLVERLAPLAPPAPLAPGGDTPVGVGLPGLVDRSGTLRFAPHLPGLVDYPFQRLLGDRIGRRRNTFVDNDATCAAWAEHQQGAGRGAGDLLLVTLGTGIGGGVVAGGRLRRGAHGFAGEIGHMVVDPQGPHCICGRRGCWECYASGSALGTMAREAALAGHSPRMVALAGGDPEAVRGEHATRAASDGDDGALAVMARFAGWVGLGLANLAAVLDPERIVLAGGLIEAGDILLQPVREAFDALVEGGSHRPPVPIVPAELGERAGAIGAALLASGAVSGDPASVL